MADTAACTTDSPLAPAHAAWRPWAGLAVMLTGTFMAVLDVFIVNIAIPDMRVTLGASFAELQFVIAGYGLTYAVMLITGGRLGDIFGRRRMFMAGLAGFTLASLACGLAPTAPLLIAARVAQGLAAAILSPQVFAMMRVGFPDERRRATAFACLGVVYGLSSVAGQLLGGLLVEADLWGLGWRPVFLINLPLGLIALVAAPLLIPESRNPEARHLDLRGVAFCAAGLLLLLFPLIEGREAGWPAWAFGLLALSVPVMAAFVWDQQRKSRRAHHGHGIAPLLEIRLFGNPVFALGVLIVLAFQSTQSAFYLALSIALQSGLHHTPLQAGLVFAPLAVIFMATSLLAGRMAGRFRHVMLSGGAALATLAFLGIGFTAWQAGAVLASLQLIPALMLLGIGCGLFMTPLLNTILGSVSGQDSGTASGMITTVQQVGSAFGIAVVGILFFGRVNTGGPDAYEDALALAALYGAAGCGLAALLLHGLRRRQQRA